MKSHYWSSLASDIPIEPVAELVEVGSRTLVLVTPDRHDVAVSLSGLLGGSQHVTIGAPELLEESVTLGANEARTGVENRLGAVRTYDAIVLLDVLDRAPDPGVLLRRCGSLLGDGGCLVVTAANAVYGEFALSLLLGRVPSGCLNPLSEGRIRRFTPTSLRTALQDSGYQTTQMVRVLCPLFHGESGIRREECQPEMVNAVLMNPEAETSQLIVHAVRARPGDISAALAERIRALEERAVGDSRRIAELEASLEAGRKLLNEVSAQREAALRAEKDAREELSTLMTTRTFRWTSPARKAYERLTSHLGRPTPADSQERRPS